jgi:MFS family permease
MTTPRTAAVFAAYAAQGLGYATVVTALPALKNRVGIDDATVSLLLLSTAVAAALGSILADVIAVRRGSRQALVAGLLTQAAALALISLSDALPLLVVGVGLYGVGLGAVDAASNMQGAISQRHTRTPIFGRLYAAYTTAAIVATLVTSAVLAWGLPALGTLLVAVVVQCAVAVWGIGAFHHERAAHRAHDDHRTRTPLPRAAIWAVGALVFAAFVVDAAVSSWSTLYLADGLQVAPGLTPLAYGGYLLTVLVVRLLTDPLVRRFGRTRVGAAAVTVGVAGAVTVAASANLPGAVIGFAAMGAAAGALVPIAFSRAGELLPARSDEVIARVNLFNYAGAIVGAVTLGLLVSGAALGPAFLIPGLLLAASSPVLRVLHRTDAPSEASATAASAAAEKPPTAAA